MLRIFLFFTFAAVLLAQRPTDLFQKAPPDVDAALRARITQFYQYHVEGKFRQAEPLVAEECKDFFYSVNKPKLVSFKIRNIEYSDNFKKAKATILADMIVALPGFMGKPVPVPFPSRWKLVNGKWYWYVELDKLNETPFGTMKATGTGNGSQAGFFSGGPNVNSVQQMVKANRSVVQLRQDTAASEQVILDNTMPGSITLSVDRIPIPGLVAKLAPAQLGAGEKATLTLQWKGDQPAPKVPVRVVVRVEPTGQTIPIQVNILAR